MPKIKQSQAFCRFNHRKLRLAAFGSYRLGLTPSITLGGRLERWPGSLDGGPQLDIGLPVGHLSLASSLSRTYGKGRNALAIAYDCAVKHFGLALSALTQSAAYAAPSLPPDNQRTRSSLTQNLSINVVRSTVLELSHTATTFSAQPAAGLFLAALNIQARKRHADLSLTLERDTGGSIIGLGGSGSIPRWTIGAQLSLMVANSSSVSVSTNDASKDGSATVELTKSAPSGPGFGYQINAARGSQQSAAAQIDYHTQYGNILALSNAAGSNTATSVTLSGSLAGFKQGVFFTEPITNAYALAQVPGFRDLAVLGRTVRRANRWTRCGNRPQPRRLLRQRDRHQPASRSARSYRRRFDRQSPSTKPGRGCREFLPAALSCVRRTHRHTPQRCIDRPGIRNRS
jgi:outer membrane usher protein